MTTNPILDLTATSPPARSSPKVKAKQGNDGSGVFDQFLFQEIDRTRPQKQVARPAAKASEKPTFTNVKSGSPTGEAPPISHDSNKAEEPRQIKRDTDQKTTPSAAESNQMNGTTFTIIAVANPEKPVLQTEAGKDAGTGTSAMVLEVSVKTFMGGAQAGQAPPEQAQGLEVAVEQPPPETNSSEPARLAEAQTKTKPTTDQVDPQIITIEDFQNLLLLQQAGKDGAQTGAVKDLSTKNSGVQNAGLPNADLQNIDTQKTAPQKSSPDVQAALAAAVPENEQAGNRSQTTGGSNIEQAAITDAPSQTRAQAYLRSLQQYGQIKEVTFYQTGEKAEPAAETEQAPQGLAVESDKADTPIQSTEPSPKQTAHPVLQETSKPVKKDVTSEATSIKQTEVQSEETLKVQGEQKQSVTILESGQNVEVASSKKSNGANQSIKVDGQTDQPSKDGQAGQLKSAQAKVETAPEPVHAAKLTSPSVLKSHVESKAANEVELSVADVVKTGDKPPPAAILNAQTSEATQQASNVRSAQRIVQQTFNHLDGMLQSGQKTLRVQLYPENLGHLELRLTSQAGSLQIVILADSSVTQQALQQNARDLQQALQESGVNLTGLTVGQRGDQEQTPQESHHTHQEYKTSVPATSESDIEEIEAAATNRMTYLHPYTSVEYRI